MTPNQARAARAMLKLDMKSVCSLADIGKRTLTEFEAGTRSVNNVTALKLKAFYISQGVTFDAAAAGEEVVGLRGSGGEEIETSYGVAAKRESLDLVDCIGILQNLSDASRNFTEIEAKTLFSRAIMLQILKQQSCNQKQIAEQLGVSAAFINAIIVGKKAIPMSMAHAIEARFGIGSSLIASEKALRGLLSELQTRVASAKAQIESLKYGEHGRAV